MNSSALTSLVITTSAQVLFATVGLAKLYDLSGEALVGAQLVLATALSTVSTVAWMVQ